MKKFLMIVLGFVFLQSNATAANTSEVGVWRLSSFVMENEESGQASNRFGEHPDGYLIFSTSGYMSVVINAERRVPMSGNLEKATEEKASLFSSMTAHAGKYKVIDGRLIHRVDVAHDPKMVGTDLLRSLRFLDSDTLESTLPTTTTPDGKKLRGVLVWKRVD